MIDESAGEEEVPDAKTAYNAFNILWSKVPRSIRAERDNQHQMKVVRAFFDQKLVEAAEELEADRRARLVEEALASSKAPAPSSPAGAADPSSAQEQDPPQTAVRMALRVCRTLSLGDLQKVWAVLDLHLKFAPEELLDIVDELQDTHCSDCGAWLDDDDSHEECPAREEEESSGAPVEEVITEADGSVTVVHTPVTIAAGVAGFPLVMLPSTAAPASPGIAAAPPPGIAPAPPRVDTSGDDPHAVLPPPEPMVLGDDDDSHDEMPSFFDEDED